MTGMDRMPWIRGLLAVTVSLVCVVPGGAARYEKERGPDPEECCDDTGTFIVRFTVKLDPANHHAVIQLRDGRIVIVRLSDGTYEVQGDRSVIIRATTDLSSLSCGFPLANGRGTVAGFPNVTGRYKDVEVAGDDIGGLLELGVGGELPTGQPICYQFVGMRDPDVPDSGDALVNYAVAYTLQLVASGALIKRPQAITIRFGDQSVLGFHMGNFIIRTDETGGMVPAGTLPLPQGLEPVASVVLDRLDGDVFNDIAVATRDPNDGTAALNVFTQTQSGTFDRTQTLTLSLEYTGGDVFVAAGDLTGDGGSEIVTASGSGRIDVFRYDSGTFALSQTLDLEATFAGLLSQVADVNGDSKSDVIVVSNGDSEPNYVVNSLLGDGAGGLSIGQSTPIPNCFDTSFIGRPQIVAGDVNGDALIDLIFGGQGGACPAPEPGPIVISMLNQANQPGTFTTLPPFDVPVALETFSLTLFTPPCAGTPALVANGGVFVGSGDGGFVDSGVRFALDGVAPVGVLAADVNLDGTVDLTDFHLSDGLLTIQTLSLGELAPRPVITSTTVVGKNLIVDGGGFTAGSQILVDGVAYKTKADRASPETRLTSKKALKKIPAGTEVTVQVQTPDGVVSDGRIFQRS